MTKIEIQRLAGCNRIGIRIVMALDHNVVVLQKVLQLHQIASIILNRSTGRCIASFKQTILDQTIKEARVRETVLPGIHLDHQVVDTGQIDINIRNVHRLAQRM